MVEQHFLTCASKTRANMKETEHVLKTKEMKTLCKIGWEKQRTYSKDIRNQCGIDTVSKQAKVR